MRKAVDTVKEGELLGRKDGLGGLGRRNKRN